MKAKDFTGLKIGRLTVVGFAGVQIRNSRSRRYWLCSCECGNTVEVEASNLISRPTQSCGCLRNELVALVNLKHGEAMRTKENRAWYGMKARCYNPNETKYPQYGGRGIIVCERWLNSYEDFLLDMGRAPSKGHTLDRIDVNGNYEPSNCRWATLKVQGNNKTTNVFLTFDGQTKTISQWADIIGYDYKALHYQLKYQSAMLADLAAAKGYKPTQL